MLGSVMVAEWPPIGKELFSRLAICSHCIVYICCFSYYPFWFRGHGFGSDCIISWSLLTVLLLQCAKQSGRSFVKIRNK